MILNNFLKIQCLFFVALFLFNSCFYLYNRKYYNTFLVFLFGLLFGFIILFCDHLCVYPILCKFILLSFFANFLLIFIKILNKNNNFQSTFDKEFIFGLILFVLFLDKINGNFNSLNMNVFVGIIMFLIVRYLYLYLDPYVFKFLQEELPKKLILVSSYIIQIVVYLLNLILLLYYLNNLSFVLSYYYKLIKIFHLILGCLFAPYAIFFLEKLSDKFVHNINLSNVDRVTTLKGFFQIIVKIFYIFALICWIFGVAWLSAFFTTFAFLAFAFQDFFRSFINGLWVLFEDSINIGEFVEVGGVSGKVEDITLRIIKLRDFEGSLFIVPFDKISIIRNRGKDYVYVVFKISIMPGIHVERVLTLIKTAFDHIKNKSEYEHLKTTFLENIEVIGLTSVSSVGMIFESRLKIRPFNTRLIKAAYYKELKALFDVENIKFGYEYWLVTNKKTASSKCK